MGAVDFTGVKLPFNATDLLTSATGLLGVVGTLVALGIAFPLVMKLIGIIKGALTKGGTKA